MIRFANPHWAYGYLFILFLCFFVYSALKQQSKCEAQFAEKNIWPYLTPSLHKKKRQLKLILFLSFFIFAVFSLMRPQWGFQWKEVPKQGVNFLVALDVSKSMLSQDIKPSRLERAKLALSDLVRKLNGDRIGLITFTSRAYLQCPLTSDYSGFLLTIKDIGCDVMPQGGTSLSAAIMEAVKTFKDVPGKEKVLIIITDGEDHEGGSLKIAQDAKNNGIIIYSIGIGTSEGDLIPIIDKEGQKVFLKDSAGNVVKTRLNETLLKEIALATGGGYVRSSAIDFGLLKIYNEKISRLEKIKIKDKKIKVYEDRFQIFLGVALICLILEFFIDEKIRMP